MVLGAGGNAPTAWEAGVIAGLADVGIELGAADVVVGTSAGSVVGAQLTGGCSPEDMFQRQVEPQLRSGEIQPKVDFRAWRAELEGIKQEAGSDIPATLRRIGAFALATPTIPEPRRRQVIASRLPAETWPGTADPRCRPGSVCMRAGRW